MIPGQHICVDVEQARAAIGAKMPPAMFRGFVDLGLPLGHLDRILCVHGPADHRRAGVTSAITAVTQRMNDEFALDLIADGAAVTAASDVTHARSPRSTRLCRFVRSIALEICDFNAAMADCVLLSRDYADFRTALSTS